MRLRAVRRRMERRGLIPRRRDMPPLELGEGYGHELQKFFTPRLCCRCFQRVICPIEISIGFVCNPCYMELIGQQKGAAA